MTPEFNQHGGALPALIASGQWQRLQDHLAQVLGLGLRTVTVRREQLVDPSWPSGFDAKLATALVQLGEELDELFPANASIPNETRLIVRPYGLSYALIPLVTFAQPAAYLVAGPVVLGKREDPQEFRARLMAQGFDPESRWALLLTVRLYSFSGIRSVIQLLEDLWGTLALVSAPGLMPLADGRETPAARDVESRLLQGLLDVATAATEADGGSIMLLDAARRTLEIRAARGLPDHIAQSARVPVGEGVAGLAALGRDIVLLDEHTTDAKWTSRMTRQEIVSSLVAPLIPDHASEPIGVLNVRTGNPNRRFTRQDVDLMKRLVTLAGTALAGLRTTRVPQSPNRALRPS